MEWSDELQRYVTDESRSECYEYSGPVALCKGGDTAKSQMDKQNQLAQQQLDLQNQKLAMISGGVGKYLTGNEGYSPEAYAMLRSQFLNNNSGDFNNAGASLRDSMAARGMGNGDLPVGGSYVRGISSLMGAQAAQHGAGLLNLGIADQQQALANKFNAASVLSGNAATLAGNVGTFNQGASNALNQYMTAANSGFGAAFMKSLGGSLGSGIGSFATGGFGSLGSYVPGSNGKP